MYAAPKSSQASLGPRSVLVVGNGDGDNSKWEEQGYRVFTLDIEPGCKPDFVASMTDMGDVGTHDVVLCCHALEHLYPHEVPKALGEFRRVLKSGGSVVVMVPDLEDVKPTEDVLYSVGGQDYSGLHLFYGDAGAMQHSPHMAHHCGFVKETLKAVMLQAGFKDVGTARAPYFNLIATGTNP